ncbi:MAG TPA: UDP-3-O-(3-hydroxymyristoyl)glucosamine N-acyltransferase [Gammaproteobacteria bacterium]|nr:UDP-3-O-(3-hydroxymyristoyl)glucosamine N-acyltransferase [Gammaproteobacteria bacterium]MEC8012011.1 UDP-3-O-(3-hydroxymyristoyl)glucosamine N-acyltransferase [Pseudomonadota bacterium]HBF09820.1 UDP-3-O-(3-hydroxymyristoyl)glucosamine N-acyltransferase [Gammaproteobacteria bacterium]HCK92441.1 UDP-3-O-(3-hydroxymyristoyl)glucosamine N-acyltransferase [Gammaproteobacteria bacterium]|tara:strand:- start:13796 stop:14818 length:1023 start_codon:yes stop_codon:yes gene_type:complete
MSFTLQDLIQHLESSGLTLEIRSKAQATLNPQDVSLTGLATLDNASESQVSFLANPKYAQALIESNAGAVFVRADQAEQCKGLALVTSNPYLAYAKASQFMRDRIGDIIDVEPGVHPTAIVADDVELGENVAIAPYVIIGAGTRLGDNVQISSHTVIGKRVSIGADTKIAPHVTIFDDVQLGQRCRVLSQTTLGADGFGYAPSANGWEAIAQLGGVIIKDDVHIGASAAVDRGALDSTVIEKGVIMDNYCMVAHNAVIGERTAMAGKSGVAGSTKVGARCTIAGQAGISGHLVVVDDVHVGMQAQVTNSITEPGQYASGTGLYPANKWRRLVVRLRQLIK